MTIPFFDTDWISDRVKAGAHPLIRRDVRRLVADGITHVVDLRQQHEWAPPWRGQDALDEIAAQGLVRLHVPVEDMTAPTPEDLDAAVAFIDEALEDPNARVYVHCRAGVQRTACVLVAWWARRHGVDYDAALHALVEKRRALWPMQAQERVAREWIRGLAAPAG